MSVANLTRSDGIDFLKMAPQAKIRTHTTVSATVANEALTQLREGELSALRCFGRDRQRENCGNRAGPGRRCIGISRRGAGTGGRACKRIDTHVSIVFLGGIACFKIKRAVSLAFLDNSTLEKRRPAVMRNSQSTPAMRRRSIGGSWRSRVKADGPRAGRDGPAIEWAVEMARFDEVTPLIISPGPGAVPSGAGGRTGGDDACVPCLRADRRAIAMAGVDRDHHRPQYRKVSRAGGAYWGGRRRGTAASAFPPRIFDDHNSLLEQRAGGGPVRQCHGDPHLANIVLIGGKPVLFDAIEFDADIATTDPLYDLAFPMMDLMAGLAGCLVTPTRCGTAIWLEAGKKDLDGVAPAAAVSFNAGRRSGRMCCS